MLSALDSGCVALRPFFRAQAVDSARIHVYSADGHHLHHGKDGCGILCTRWWSVRWKQALHTHTLTYRCRKYYCLGHGLFVYAFDLSVYSRVQVHMAVKCKPVSILHSITRQPLLLGQIRTTRTR